MQRVFDEWETGPHGIPDENQLLLDFNGHVLDRDRMSSMTIQELHQIEHLNTFTDAMYFSMVLVTTVIFGKRIDPSTASAKFVAVFFIVFSTFH